jgi:hypothetical protein
VSLGGRQHAPHPPGIAGRGRVGHIRPALRLPIRQLPVDVDLIASCLGIKRRAASLAFAGRIYAEENGQLVMDLNANDSEPRRRFTAILISLATRGRTMQARFAARI